MKNLIALLLVAICMTNNIHGQEMVDVNKWVSPVTKDFTTIPASKGTDAQLTSFGYTSKIFQFKAYLTRPSGTNVAVVNRWEMPNCREFILIAEHEISDAKMTEFGYKNKQFVFYAYRTRPATGDFVAVNRWVNTLAQGNGCRDFTLSVAEHEVTDAQLTSFGYTNKLTQFYVPLPPTDFVVDIPGGILRQKLATIYPTANFQGTASNIGTVGRKTLTELGISSVGSMKVAWGYKAILKIGTDLIVPPNPITRAGGGTVAARTLEIVGDREGDIPNGITSIEIVNYTPLNGWVDMHTHPMSHLGFGRKLMHGVPDIGSLIPAGTKYKGTNLVQKECNEQNERATSIETALGNCNATHGGWGFDNDCGNYIRAGVISLAFDKDFVHKVSNVHGDHQHSGVETSPSFLYWPHQSSKAHQQMWWEWIRRAYSEGGLRVMVALTVNSELLANVIDGDLPYDDKTTADVQIAEIISFVGRHNDFMQIARSAADLRRIVASNKLAVILGMEVDNLGNFNKANCNEITVRNEIARLRGLGVRYVFPIHLVDNKFGGTAVYEDLFNYASKYTSGSLFTVQSSSTVDANITSRLGIGLDGNGNLDIKKILDDVSSIPLLGQGISSWDKFQLIRNLISPDPLYASYAQIQGGHVNSKGLSPLGKFAIKELMRNGMMIDIDHMSQLSVNNTLDTALSYLYPVNIGHNGLRGNGGKERAAARATIQSVAQLGGIFGIGTADSEEGHSDAESYIANFSQISPLIKGVAIGSDVNGMERLPRASQGLNSNEFYSDFPKCTTGNRTWDYTTEGVAHYGLMADYIKDIKNRNITVYNNLMKSTEYFAQMWEKCERRRAYIR